MHHAIPEHVVIHYLEMDDPSELKAKAGHDSMDIRECEEKLWRYNRFLYELVGRHWAWEDKLKWTDQQWKAYAEADELSTHVAYVRGTPAGYFELQEQADRVFELAYFGLVRRFIGQGLGGILLSRALATAWDLGASKIWLHTCSLDHPHALNNYLARGMKLMRSETVPFKER